MGLVWARVRSAKASATAAMLRNSMIDCFRGDGMHWRVVIRCVDYTIRAEQKLDKYSLRTIRVPYVGKLCRTVHILRIRYRLQCVGCRENVPCVVQLTIFFQNEGESKSKYDYTMNLELL